MATKIALCNRALRAIKRAPIGALTDATEEARACTTYYEACVRDLLSLHDWAFATKTVALAEHADEPPPDWAYRYTAPPDLLHPIQVLTDGSTRTEGDRLGFQVELLEDESDQCILTDASPAYLRYVFFKDAPDLMDDLFATALVYRLGSELAIALNNDEDTQAKMIKLYEAAIDKAKAKDLNAGVVERETPGAVRARA
jgi:hypothetical protein